MKPIRKYLVIPDTHVPKHDRKAYAAMLEYARTLKPDGCIILGDFVDCESLMDASKGPSSPRRITYAEEIGPANTLLDETEKALGPQCKDRWFLMGNHEGREKAYAIKNPEMAGKINIRRDLRLDKRGWKVHQRGRRTIQIGKLQFHHGIYTSSGHASAHATKLGGNVAYGHCHDVSSATVVHGMTPHGAWSLGCLCKLDQNYLEVKGLPTNWQHAFGVVYFRPNGHFNIYPVYIYNGRFVGLDGKEYGV